MDAIASIAIGVAALFGAGLALGLAGRRVVGPGGRMGATRQVAPGE